MCSNAVRKLPFVLRYVPDQDKTQEMCHKIIVEDGGPLEFCPDCYNNQKMHNRAVDNYTHALEFVPNCYKTQKMCNRVVDTYVLLCFILFLIDIRLK